MKTSQLPLINAGPLGLTLNEAQERNIDLLCQVANQNGAPISLKEIMELTSLDTREEELLNAWNRSELLSDRYSIVGGRVIEKTAFFIETNEVRTRYDRAESYLNHARKFSTLFKHDKDLEMLSVSGSTSYCSVSEDDDLDFFCITRNDSLWIFLSKALIRSRLFRARDKGSPVLCFSFVIEESHARKLFSKHGDGLFARDAITAIVLKGEEFYRNLLKENKGIGSYFPKMYSARIPELSSMQPKIPKYPSQSRASIARKIANRILQHTLGNYIRFKSNLLNRRFAKTGDNKRIFKVHVRKGCFLFESNGYLELRKKYAGLKSNS